MKKNLLNGIAGLQIAGATLLGLITLLNFKPDDTWFLLGCILTGLVAVGLISRSKLALVTEFVLLTSVCALLLVQTCRRIWALFTGVWLDCLPAFIMGFMFEQAVLIPTVCAAIVLLLYRRQFQKSKKI